MGFSYHLDNTIHDGLESSHLSTASLEENVLYWEGCMAEDGLTRLDHSTFIIQDSDGKLEMLKVWNFFTYLN